MCTPKPTSANRIIEMYHSKTTTGKAQEIMGEFGRRGSCTRVVVTTLALGLGVDIEDVEVVINWGVEEALTYWQEVGRCARRIPSGVALLYAYRRSYTNMEDDTMKELVKGERCVRATLLANFRIPGTPDLGERAEECQGREYAQLSPPVGAHPACAAPDVWKGADVRTSTNLSKPDF